MTNEQREPGWISVTAHAYREEPADDLIHFRLQGDVYPEEVLQLMVHMERFAKERAGPIFLLGNFAGMGSVGTEARKALSQGLLPISIGAVALYGASFTQRVIATLVDKTNNFVRGGRRYPTRFFAAEEQGRAWLAEKRLELAPR